MDPIHLHPEVTNPFKRGMRVMFKNIDVPRSHPELRRGTVTDSHELSVTVEWDAREYVPASVGSYHYTTLIEIQHEPVVVSVAAVIEQWAVSMLCVCKHSLRTHGPIIDGVIGSCGSFGCKCLHGEPA